MFTKQQRINWRKILVIIGTPILLLPLLIFFNSDAIRCGYIILILITYWSTEVIPLPITSLLPLILFPVLGVLKASEVAPDYFRDMMSLFFGSVTLSFAIQNVNLHQRVALLILNLVGSSVKWMLAGVMVTTWLLSMWINNAGTASIMLPVALAIADEYAHSSNSLNEGEEYSKEMTNIEEQKNDILTKKADNIKKSFLLSVAYSTTYGGFATIVGCATPIFFKGYIDEEYMGTDFRLTFFNYFLVAAPASALMLIFCWIWLLIRYELIQWPFCNNPSSNEVEEHLEQKLKQQYNELGYFRWNELIVTILFFIAVILWMTRDLGKTYGGWSVLFRSEYVTHGTVAMFVGVLCMVLPNEKPFTKNWTYKPIVAWNDLSKNFPWGIMILLGAGLSIAHASKVSKLSNIFVKAFQFIHGGPPFLILIAVIIMSEILTQFIGSISMAGILFPVISSMSGILGIHPAYLLIPCTIALCQSFTLPVSSQPNAIVFSTGFLRTTDMIATGVVLNIVGGVIIFIASTTWMLPLFGLNQSFHSNLTHINVTFANST